MSGNSGLRYSIRALRHRDFALFWTGAAVSNIGGWLLSLTIPYIVFQETHSALWVGLVAVSQFVPQVITGPLGGVLADQHDRRKVLFFTQAGLAIGAFAVWAIVVLVAHPLVPLMVAMGLMGCINGLNMPSWQAIVHDLVPREDLTSAVALHSFQVNAARALGPALAGFLLYVSGPSWALLFNAVSFGAVIIALALMRPQRQPRVARSTEGVLRQFRKAGRYLPTQPGIMIALFMTMVVGLLVNPMWQLTIVFADSVFHVGPAQLGLMNAAIGIGAVAALPAMAGWSHVLTLTRLAKAALFIQAAGVAGFALAPNALFGALSLILVGGGFMLAMSSSITAIQLIVADRFRGRVISIRIMTFVLAVPVGSAAFGALSDSAGPRLAALMAAAALLIVGIVAVLLRGRASLNRLADPHDDSVA